MTTNVERPSSTSALLVLPTYNEAGTVEEVITRAFEAAPDLSILVVDDGSDDGTIEAVEACMEKHGGDVHLLKREDKSGLGDAYRTGFEWGLERDFDLILEMDADLQHDPAVLADLIIELDGGADLAIGSRYVHGGGIAAWSAGRRAISRGGNRAAQFMLDLPIADSTSGFRGYQASLLRSIDLTEVQSDGYGFQVEMAYLCHERHAAIVELPITFSDREYGESKMDTAIAIEAAQLLMRLRSRRTRDRRAGSA